MLLVLGLPGFVQYALLTLPWSALALSLWGVAVWRLVGKRPPGPPEAGAGAVRGCAAPLLLGTGVLVPWLTAFWHPAASALVFWAVPGLLVAMALMARREHLARGRGLLASVAPLVAFQVQLMVYGVLLWVGHILNGGSPI